MTREKVEDLRERLLRDEQVQRLIRMRAYEIYKQRGGRPGNPAEDWVRAESEVLAYVIEEESKRTEKADEPIPPSMEEERAEGPRTLDTINTPETVDRASEPNAQTSEERAESQGILSAWSSAEPASAARAPELGHATEKAKVKKGGTRSTSRASSTKKTVAAEGKPATETPKKRTASKTGVAKKSAPGKSSGSAKGEKSKG